MVYWVIEIDIIIIGGVFSGGISVFGWRGGGKILIISSVRIVNE